MALHRRRTEFWGEGPSHRETGDFSFHCLTAHVPEEVQRHSHDEAHFVLVLGGGYMSSARGAPDISSTPLLVFNPAGTTHRDRFFGGTPDTLPRTLVIHGTLDPNTSYAGAQAHVAILAKARPVAMTTVERGAHMLAFFAPACFVAATTAFLDDAAVAPSCSEPDPTQ